MLLVMLTLKSLVLQRLIHVTRFAQCEQSHLRSRVTHMGIKLCALIAFSGLIFGITKPHFKDCCSDLKMHFFLETIVKICPQLGTWRTEF